MNFNTLSPQMTIGALLHLKKVGALFDRSVSSGIMWSVLKKYDQQGELSIRQLDTIRFNLHKYSRYLKSGWDPANIEIPQGKRAILNSRDSIRLFVPKNSGGIANEIIKMLDGLRNVGDGAYLCDATRRNIHVLKNAEFECNKRLLSLIESKMDWGIADKPDGVLIEPYKEQLEGLSFLLKRNGRAILADEPGAGKTAQCIMWAQAAKPGRVLITCPASYKYDWQSELNAWLGPQKSIVLEGESPPRGIQKELRKYDWVILNHHILRAWKDKLKQVDFGAMFVDEAHHVANPDTIAGGATKSIANKIKNIILISGTLKSRPIQLYPLINMIDPALFPSKLSFANRFCGIKNTGFGWDMRGSKDLAELNKILTDSIMKRQTVSHLLPELSHKVVPFVLPEKAMQQYKHAETAFVDWLKTCRGRVLSKCEEKAAAMLKINELKKLTSEMKRHLVFDWLDNHIESCGKLVVFTYHQKTVDDLAKKYKSRAIAIDGRVPAKKRKELKDKFQTDEKIEFAIVNTQAGGEAITLTAACHSVITEFGWLSTEIDQAIKRTHRRGQTKPCIAYYLVAQGTIDEQIIELLDQKRQSNTAILDGFEVSEDELLTILLEKYK